MGDPCSLHCEINTVVHGGEWCTDHSYDLFDRDRSDTFYCEHNCCGDYYDKHCCLSSEAGMIVGIVIGSLVFVGLVVSGIVCCFCCLRKNRGRQGQVVTGQQAASVQMTTVQSPYMQQPYMQQQQPYMPQPGPYPTGAYPAQGYPQGQPGNPNPGFEPPKYSEVVNPQ